MFRCGIFFVLVTQSDIAYYKKTTTFMGRREELEKELEIAQRRIDEAPADIPDEILDAYKKELDSIAFELNNLYDDPETETE